MKKMQASVWAVLAAAVVSFVRCSAEAVVLTKDGRACAEIVVGDGAVNAARFGAIELAAHLKAVTGATFPIVTDSTRTPGRYPICVGAGVEASKAGFGGFGRQEHVVGITRERTVLLGVDDPSTNMPQVVYTNGVVVSSAKNLPDRWRAHGSLNAVYDFLHAECGVRWLDSSDFGTTVPSRPTLTAEPMVRRAQPFVFCRNTNAQPEEWSSNRRNPDQGYGLWAWTKAYYPLAYSRGTLCAFLWNNQKRVWLLRVRAGGESLSANHSFYWCYERFFDKGHKNFVAYHPDWFARYRKHKAETRQQAADAGEVTSEYDTSKRPGQMCYSNRGFIEQTVRDVRAYFDAGGYTNSYSNTGFATPQRPNATWGRDTYCLEPMDNAAYCECPDCLKQYEPDRKGDRAEHSTYFFRFVNAVAKEVKKTHPKCKISTLAYGTHEGLPTGFEIEDNVVVHFCWDGNRMVNRTQLNAKQTGRIAAWRAAYPKNPLGLWLYNGFPNESSQWYGYINFPGFFAREFEREFHFIRDQDIRECIFNCGMKDDFESYCCNRWFWNPSEPLKAIKDDFFASYGAAERPIRAFYDLVEDRFCSTNVWHGYQGHMIAHYAWGYLGDEPTMAKLATYMKEAESAEGLTPQQRARVVIWRKGIWDYMCHGKYNRDVIKSGKEGVNILRTRWYGAHPDAFGPSQIEGKPFVMTPLDGKGSLAYLGGEKGETAARCFAITKPGDDVARGFTAPLGKRTFTNILLRCDAPVERLARVRLTTALVDPARSRMDVTLVGWINDKRVELCPAIVNSRMFNFDYPRETYPGVITYDLDFAPGAAPSHLDAIGIEDRSLMHGWNNPRFLKLQVSDCLGVIK